LLVWRCCRVSGLGAGFGGVRRPLARDGWWSGPVGGSESDPSCLVNRDLIALFVDDHLVVIPTEDD